MNKILLSLALLACVTVQAEPLVYKLNLSTTRSGGGNEAKTKLSGFMVFDGDSDELAFLIADISTKNFHTLIPSEFSAGNVLAGRISFSVLRLTANEELCGLVAKGNNTVKEPKDGELIPRSMVLSGTSLFAVEHDPLWRSETFKGSAVYDAKKTVDYFEQALGMNLVLLKLQAELLSKGFSPE